jgi:ATP-binding cassette, subfamily B, multidrug efflux pump
MKNRYFEDEVIKKGMSKAHYRRLFTYLLPYKKDIIFATIVILITGVLASVGPFLMKVAFDDVLPEKDLMKLFAIVGILAAVIVTNIKLFKVRVNVVTRIGQNAIYQIREDVFKHLQRLPFNYFDDRPHGKIIVRVVNYINAISDLLSQGIIDVLAEFVALAMVLVFMLVLHPQLALLCIVIVPLSFSLIIIVRKKFHRELQILNNKQSNMNAYIHESISGLKVTQAFVREDENMAILENLMVDYKDQFMRSKRMKFLTGPIINISETLAMILILVLGAYWIQSDYLTLGILVAFLGYMGQFWQPMNKISDFLCPTCRCLILS